MYNPISLGNWRPVLVRQPVGVSDVALTFDDGPTPETTPGVLGLLAAAQASATFFLTGARVAANPQLVADICAGGHAVYGHAWDHSRQEVADGDRAVAAMRRVEDELRRFRPTPNPYLVRLPYNTGYRTAGMHRAMRHFHPNTLFAYCTLSPRDYTLAVDCMDRALLGARCLRAAEWLYAHPELPGSIVLLHEQPFGAVERLNAMVAEALLGPLLAGIADRGLRAGPIDTTAPLARLGGFLMKSALGYPRVLSLPAQGAVR